MKVFKIERNIPIPPKSVGVINYPFIHMKVGDSFLVLFDKDVNVKKAGKNIGSCATRFRKANNLKWRFTYRQVGKNQVRIWRDK